MYDARDRFDGGLIVHVIHRMEPARRLPLPEPYYGRFLAEGQSAGKSVF
jgi:hypothetical protein